MKKKINIDINNFLKTGDFDLIKIGMSKEQILKIYNKPDDYFCLNNENVNTSPIWIYGTYELHFNQNNKITSIYNDYLNEKIKSNNLKINYGILQYNNLPNIINCISYLMKERLKLIIEYENDNILIKINKSNIKLLFNNSDIKDYNKLLITAIQKE